MDASNFEQFLQERIKVNGKAGTLGGGVVTIKRSKSRIIGIIVASEVPFPKHCHCCGLGHCCGAGLIPGLGIFACHGRSQKIKLNNETLGKKS
uniref:Large ribosomal subunit protein eL22 n=1 Tax=Catagonus wagneri TaxID=51154 RepID=A0A8C3YQM6_9CETA